MSMPFYVAPEQVMKDRADYARKGIARGRSLVAFSTTDGIVIVAENPSPLVASFDLMADSVPEVSTRIKMGKTSDVVAVVKANGQLYSATKNVKVTIGGCGG